MDMKISCITICKNNKDGLRETLDSILNQTKAIYEVVVVDGASNDGTLEELHKFKKQFDDKRIKFSFISERDTGIYNAMNKGVKIASGNWLIFMNSGDKFASNDVIEKVLSYKIRDGVGIFYGDYYKKFENELKHIKSQPIRAIRKRMFTCHQSMFFSSKEMLNRPYNEKYYMTGDYAWVLEYYLQNGHFQYIPVDICVYDMSGLSSQSELKRFEEYMRVRNDYGVGNPMWLVNIKKMIFIIKGMLTKKI